MPASNLSINYQPQRNPDPGTTSTKGNSFSDVITQALQTYLTVKQMKNQDKQLEMESKQLDSNLALTELHKQLAQKQLDEYNFKYTEAQKGILGAAETLRKFTLDNINNRKAVKYATDSLKGLWSPATKDMLIANGYFDTEGNPIEPQVEKKSFIKNALGLSGHPSDPSKWSNDEIKENPEDYAIAVQKYSMKEHKEDRKIKIEAVDREKQSFEMQKESHKKSMEKVPTEKKTFNQEVLSDISNRYGSALINLERVKAKDASIEPEDLKLVDYVNPPGANVQWWRETDYINEEEYMSLPPALKAKSKELTLAKLEEIYQARVDSIEKTARDLGVEEEFKAVKPSVTISDPVKLDIKNKIDAVTKGGKFHTNKEADTIKYIFEKMNFKNANELFTLLDELGVDYD